MTSNSNDLGLSGNCEMQILGIEEDQIGIDSSAISLPIPEGMPNNPSFDYSLIFIHSVYLLPRLLSTSKLSLVLLSCLFESVFVVLRFSRTLQFGL